MGKSKSLLIFFGLIFFVTILLAQTQSQSYLNYIKLYSDLAQKQQKQYGIPASITLAQGLLESGAGNGKLAKNSNNHFGIKCSDWSGEKVYHDDDEKGECFRKYDNVLDSYEDHSRFLKNRSRYAFLFELRESDYEAWAFGLKKAGYATDPTYAYKLISIVENYDLHKYDLGKKPVLMASGPEKKSTVAKVDMPSSKSMGTINAYTKHQVMKVNGVLFVSSVAGDTYAAIADEFDISETRIRKFNDLIPSATLTPGTRVFIARKKKKAPKECELHTVLPGETMASIAQDYAIQITSLYKLNQMSFDQGAVYGKILKLR